MIQIIHICSSLSSYIIGNNLHKSSKIGWFLNQHAILNETERSKIIHFWKLTIPATSAYLHFIYTNQATGTASLE